MHQQNTQERKANILDFNTLSLIGKGTYGKIFLVQKNNDQEFYAMKTIRKDKILNNKLMDSITLEM